MKKLSKDAFSNVTITKETKLEEAARVMISNNINEVDVLNSKNKYIGTVYLNDVMASIINPIDEQ